MNFNSSKQIQVMNGILDSLDMESLPRKTLSNYLFAELSYLDSSLVGIISQLENGKEPSTIILPDFIAFFESFNKEMKANNSDPVISEHWRLYRSYINKMMQIYHMLCEMGAINYASANSKKGEGLDKGRQFTTEYYCKNRDECVAEYNIYFKNTISFSVKIKIYKIQMNERTYYEGNSNIDIELNDSYLASEEYTNLTSLGDTIEESLENSIYELRKKFDHMLQFDHVNAIQLKEYDAF